MADAAGFATRQEPSWSPWRAVALALSAESQLLLGDVDQATRLFTQTSVVATQLGNIHSVILSNAELAVLAMDHGRWAQAAEHAELALSTVHAHRLNDYSLSVLAYAAAARLAVHDGNRKEADAQIARAMRARPTCTYAIPWLAVRVRLQLAKVHAAIADPAPRAICCSRSTTSLATGQLSGRLFRRCRRCAAPWRPVPAWRHPEGLHSPRRSSGYFRTCRPT